MFRNTKILAGLGMFDYTIPAMNKTAPYLRAEHFQQTNATRVVIPLDPRARRKAHEGRARDRLLQTIRTLVLRAVELVRRARKAIEWSLIIGGALVLIESLWLLLTGRL